MKFLTLTVFLSSLTGFYSICREDNLSNHWAYQTIDKPTIPKVEKNEWCKEPLDFFILKKLEENKINPNKQCSSTTWLRRVHFDLIGLPPSLELVKNFSGKDTPKFRKEIVDRLLESPHFGERWARHWLDLARYGDSTGIHEDVVRPSWAWRDWVVQAFNKDMPFDQFTIEQLAGDLLPNATLSQKVATGFHRAAPFNTEGGTPKEARRSYQVLDRVNVTGTVWLGTTMECAQCHDHFYDPISQKEYYQLVAIFNNTPDEMGKSIGAGRSAMAGPTVKIGNSTTFVMQEMPKKRMTQIFLRGNYESKGEKVSPGVPSFLHIPTSETPKDRLGLAKWLTDPQNPLTPRVTVNRLWTEIFGSGLVSTGADFGTQGDSPTHPKLLDWLAADFVEGNWSMKSILRKIVLSSTYSQSPEVETGKNKLDPKNRFLGRFPKLRLSAEAIRDNALSIAGILTPSLGGPPIYPPQPDGIWWIRDDKSPKYDVSKGEARYRRTLYTIWRRTYLHPTLANFDAPNRVTCSVTRERTNTPLQALTLMNDPIFLEAAFGLARRLFKEQIHSSVESVIRIGFQLATTRKPNDDEVEVLTKIYEKSMKKFSADNEAAYKLTDSVRGELSLGFSPLHTSEIASLASWFHIANALLNLDETISKG